MKELLIVKCMWCILPCGGVAWGEGSATKMVTLFSLNCYFEVKYNLQDKLEAQEPSLPSSATYHDIHEVVNRPGVAGAVL